MDSPSRISRKKVLALILGLLVVAVVAAYAVVSSGILEEKIDAEIKIETQIEDNNLVYATVETNLPDDTNIVVSLVGIGESNETRTTRLTLRYRLLVEKPWRGRFQITVWRSPLEITR